MDLQEKMEKNSLQQMEKEYETNMMIRMNSN